MINFDGFDRKSFRKSKIEEKKKDKRFGKQNIESEDYRFSKVSKQNLKKRIQQMEEEEKWEDWENEIH
jgi:hypothetical protein